MQQSHTFTYKFSIKYQQNTIYTIFRQFPVKLLQISLTNLYFVYFFGIKYFNLQIMIAVFILFIVCGSAAVIQVETPSVIAESSSVASQIKETVKVTNSSLQASSSDNISANSSQLVDSSDPEITKFEIVSSEELVSPKYQILDVAFVLDTTGSMSAQIAEVKDIIQNIIKSLQQKVIVTNLQLRFGVVAYRDHNDEYLTKKNDFTNDYETVRFVQSLQAGGGGDRQEAVHNGLNVAATELSWKDYPDRDELRYIFHIADAAPHGKQFLNPQKQEGCTCGLKTDDVLKEINDKKIHYRLLKVRPYDKLEKMEEIFKQKLDNFQSQIIIRQRNYDYKTYPSVPSPSPSRGSSDVIYRDTLTLLLPEPAPQLSLDYLTETSSESASALPTPAPASKSNLKEVVAGYILDDIYSK